MNWNDISIDSIVMTAHPWAKALLAGSKTTSSYPVNTLNEARFTIGHDIDQFDGMKPWHNRAVHVTDRQGN